MKMVMKPALFGERQARLGCPRLDVSCVRLADEGSVRYSRLGAGGVVVDRISDENWQGRMCTTDGKACHFEGGNG
jgi:hypothetical protein